MADDRMAREPTDNGAEDAAPRADRRQARSAAADGVPPRRAMRHPVATQMGLVTGSIALSLLVGIAGIPGAPVRVAGEGSDQLRQGWAARHAATAQATAAPIEDLLDSSDAAPREPVGAVDTTDDHTGLEHQPRKR